MELIYLLNSGFYVKDNDGNLVKIDKLNRYLNYVIQIGIEDGDVTLLDLFNILIEKEDEVDYLFESWTRGFKLRPYYEQIVKDPIELTNIKYIEVSWIGDYMEWEDDDLNLKKDFDMFINVSGISEEDHYSIGLSSLSNFKNLPIRINTNYKINGFVFIDDERIDKELKDIFSAETDITLQDFIAGILNEITFHGYPEHKNNFIKELEGYENIDEEDCIDSVDFEIEWLNKDIERLLSEEKYEKAAKVKKKIEKLEAEKKSQ